VTASPGGVYYVYGEALAKILTEKLGITVNPLPTQGTVHNVKLVDGGGAQLGMTTMGVGLQSWNGTGDWTGGKRFQRDCEPYLGGIRCIRIRDCRKHTLLIA
jgi:TRAP-type uncharacterized transport system substrate-binding protein